ncbi:MAG: DUF924 domain-containing protein [Bdellovibrionales bacterium]|nr:DUF924 domain-containing protein [Bdellovibrionales bacterium]
MDYESIHEYWFGPEILSSPEYFKERGNLWFGKNEDVDQYIREHFAPMLKSYEEISQIELPSDPKQFISTIILLDQMTRNAFRGQEKMYHFDPIVLDFSKRGISKHLDQDLHCLERAFCYLPLEHSEKLEDQTQCVELYATLHEQCPSEYKEYMASMLEYAHKHKVIVERFGRFPHRNEILVRESTKEEILFLQEKGSSF